MVEQPVGLGAYLPEAAVTATAKHRHELSGGRVAVIDIPAKGEVLTLSVEFAGAGNPISLTHGDAMTIGLALQHAATLVGQREAPRRAREARRGPRR